MLLDIVVHTLNVSIRRQRPAWSTRRAPDQPGQHSEQGSLQCRLTSSLKYETSFPSYPAHVFKPQQSDVHAQLRTALPDATDVIGAYSRNQGHWRKEAYF